MATNKITRTDDSAAILQNIATVTATEDAVTKHWQGVVVGDAADPASNKLTITAAGEAEVTLTTALPTGTNNIGDVDVLTIAAGDNNIGNVDVVSLPALPAGANNIGDVDVLTIAAGDNNIGNVDIASIAAGDNNIGNVDVVSSALPTGASTLAEQQTQTTALQLIDNAVSGAGFNITQQGGVAVSLNTGVRDTGTQRVTIATNDLVPISAASLPLPTGAATAAEQATQTASLNVLDDWDESDRAKVNPIAGQVGVQGGAGTSTALTQRIAIATDANAVSFAATDTVGTPVVLNSPNERATVALAGQQSASVQFSDGSSPVLTANPQCSLDGGTTWLNTRFIDASSTWFSSIANPGNVGYGIHILPGSTHAGVEIDPYTSGSITATLRATAGAPQNIVAVLSNYNGSQPIRSEDTAHFVGDSGISILGVRDDSPAIFSGTDGDYEQFHISPEGGLWTSPTPSASGGLSIFRSLDLDETEEQIKATAGSVYGMWFTNTATATRFLKFYNATAATVVVGTTAPVLTIGLPGNLTDDITGAFGSAHGIAFGTAITVAVTTGEADADTGAPGTGDVIVNVFYK